MCPRDFHIADTLSSCLAGERPWWSYFNIAAGRFVISCITGVVISAGGGVNDLCNKWRKKFIQTTPKP